MYNLPEIGWFPKSQQASQKQRTNLFEIYDSARSWPKQCHLRFVLHKTGLKKHREFEKWIFKGGKNRLFGNCAEVLVRQFLLNFISLRGKSILVTFKVQVRFFSRLFEEGWSGQPKYSNTFYIYSTDSTLHRFQKTESHFPLQQTD